MSTDEPQRWLESDGLDEALRADLEAAADDDVGYDVDAAVARFEATLARGGPPDGGGEAGPGGTGAAVTAAGGSAASKGLALVVSVAVIVGGGAIAWSLAGSGARTTSAPVVAADEQQARVEPAPTNAGSSASDPSRPITSREPVPTAKPAVLPDADASADVMPTPEPGLATDPPKPRPSRGTPRSPSSTTDPDPPADDDRLRREMQATDRAQKALASDPSRALTLIRKADAEFPEGLFAEDREGIAILALFALDRTAEARRRAEAFLRAHPRSSHADRIRAAIDGEHEKP